MIFLKFWKNTNWIFETLLCIISKNNKSLVWDNWENIKNLKAALLLSAVRILFDCLPTQAETSARVKFGLENLNSDLFICSNITNLVSNEWTKTHLYV